MHVWNSHWRWCQRDYSKLYNRCRVKA
jgi:hypothetical protein